MILSLKYGSPEYVDFEKKKLAKSIFHIIFFPLKRGFREIRLSFKKITSIVTKYFLVRG